MIDQLSHKVEELVKGTPGTRDVRNPLNVARTNPQAAHRFAQGAAAGRADGGARPGRATFSGGRPGWHLKETTGEQYPIVVRTPISQQAQFGALEEVRVPSLSGSSLPLSQLASLEFEKAPTLIQRFNRERAMTIDADAAEGYNVSA